MSTPTPVIDVYLGAGTHADLIGAAVRVTSPHAETNLRFPQAMSNEERASICRQIAAAFTTRASSYLDAVPTQRSAS